ncbi:hypothetical protein, variant [Spizellomyces punctatus DAOM BR117]|uniref:PNPLA domain-containing protein n=1 Tax=Spizellomyces punctatus (strain DAOM BR117) TaxID=645134 RepID=A0A0L0H6R1_SPIPD|nr:hypothetical protein, variant [Spizellomyces punctatus DAOM BR117]KNC96423.1 hypothetical protein, variant [Spizellomyces punctatus DAOM BR117]|eukprot:XP_016604463.1 hypothetical protein, variant [Spizellomyces punctatus DAOM BR117]
MSTGNDVWKADATSNIYDYKLIQFRLEHLAEVRDSGDVAELIYLLRSGLLRNLGGIGDPRLFSRSYLGTKSLIEDYLNQVVTQLQYIQRNDFEVLSPQQKVEFFHDTRQSFGNTALLLEGGATFGLFHLGVVKALSEHHLLPRIISGSSVGALIAALVCVHTEQDLPCIFQPGGINLKAFAKKGIKGNITRKITRLLKYGYLMDVKVLEDCVRSNVGDLTFEEAYARSKRVLNITVASTRKYEVPRLLNYLTAPNVLIWSAACASAAVMGLYESVDLLAKDNYGNIVHWSPSAISWSDSSCESDSPEIRLAEQFNVNHFILSQANPYIAPFLSKCPQGQGDSLSDKLFIFLSSEIRHRLHQLAQIGLMPRTLQTLFEQRAQGHITIAPPLSSMDFYQLFSNPTYASLNYWILKGEQSTWPFLSFIRSRTKIELALDKGNQ